MNLGLNTLIVAMGGALGSSLRYLTGLAIVGPLGTLVINVVGSALMGVLLGFGFARGSEIQLFLGVGILGGFTTFSAFSADTLQLWEKSESQAFLYVAGSVLLSLAVCFLSRKLVVGLHS